LLIGSTVLRSCPGDIAALVFIAGLVEFVSGSPLPIFPLFRHANALASMILGIRTQLLQGQGGPGGVAFTGESVLEWPKEIDKGKLKAVFAVGDGLIHMIGSSGLESLNRLDFLAVVSDFMTPLASRADLIIPRLAPFENSGTILGLDGLTRRLERIVPNPDDAWALERFYGEIAHSLGADLPVERSAIRSEIASEFSALSSVTDGPGAHIERPARVAFRMGVLKHSFDTVEPPSKNRFGVIVSETVFQHDSRGAHMPHVARMPENFACGMNKDDMARLGLEEGRTVRILGEPGELIARVKKIRVPHGYVLLPAEFINNSIADLGVLSNPDIRVSLEIAE
jgi:predicted molibdopterin-dependent oxidoreductase YjgC